MHLLFRVSLRVAVCVLALSAAMPARAASERDPWESLNRKTYVFNDSIDRWFLKPVGRGYRAVTPQPVDDSISRFFVNLRELPDIVDFALQGDMPATGSSLLRLLGNSTIGIGGLFDPVGAWGLPNRDTTFGTTLGKWGVGSGPYLVLPFLGPSTVRNAIGMPVDWVSNPVVKPWTLVPTETLRYGLVALDVVDTRGDLLAFEEAVIGDRYSFFRDAYLQKSDYDVNGSAEEDPFLDDFPEEELSPDPSPTDAAPSGMTPSDTAPSDEAAPPASSLEEVPPAEILPGTLFPGASAPADPAGLPAGTGALDTAPGAG